MSHPGPGPDMNPSGQQPGQPGQPFQPGQPGPAGQPGQPYQPFDQQPGQPNPQQPGQQPGAWTPPGATPTGEPAKKSGLTKVLPAVGGLAVAGLLFTGAQTDWFGLTGIEVGDCVKGGFGGEDVETVDCGSDEAENKVVGIEEQEMTYDEFMADDTICTDFASAMSALWYGPPGDDEDGTIYCAEPV